LSGAAASVRRRRPFLDHVVRAYGRYTDDGGDRLAASASYFAFLSFFPLVALAFSITGFVVDAYPDLQQKISEQIDDYLPGLADKLDVKGIAGAKVGVGLIGLAVLVLSGLAWIDALRDSIRLMWHQKVEAGNIIMVRVRDVGILAGLGLTVLASLVVTSLSTSATRAFLDWVGLGGSALATSVTGVFAVVVALAIDVAVFLYLFWRLPETTDHRRTVRAALLGAVGVELLKIFGTWLVGRTTSNPVYGVFAVIFGLLIWINIVMRWTMFIAAWAVTAPYSSDVAPSGSAAADEPVETGEPAGPPEPPGSPEPGEPADSGGDGGDAAGGDAAGGDAAGEDAGNGRPAVAAGSPDGGDRRTAASDGQGRSDRTGAGRSE
jgi:membrane protein